MRNFALKLQQSLHERSVLQGFRATPSGCSALLGCFPFGHFERGQGGHEFLQAGRVKINRRAVVVSIHDRATAVLRVANVLPSFEAHWSLAIYWG